MSKCVLVLGATSAIARATMELWAQKGFELFLVARDGQKLDAIGKDLETRFQRQFHTRVADLDQFEGHEPLIDEAFGSLGNLDMVLVAHGVLGDQNRAEQDWGHASDLLVTNFMSYASLLTHVAKRMEEQGHGVLAVISSVAGDRGRASNYVYGSAKAGLSALLGGLRNRLFRRGVHVVTIKPGFVSTPMTAHLRQGPLFAKPETIAKAIVRGVAKKKNVVYAPFWWFWVMLVIRLIPEFIFKRLKL